MKRILLSLCAVFMLVSCATVPGTQVVNDRPAPDYQTMDIYISDLPKAVVNVPNYAMNYIHDYDKAYTVHLSENIVMLFFIKDPEDFLDLNDLGHAVAVIVDTFYNVPLFFQTTIQEDQRFFYYEYTESDYSEVYHTYDEASGDPKEITKPDYREFLEFVIKMDKQGARYKP